MRRNIIQLGISISDSSIEIVEIRKSKQGLFVDAASRLLFEHGVVEKGVIVDEQRFLQLLKQAISKAKPKPFSTKKIILSLPEVVSFLHVFRFPPTVTEQELRSAIRFQAEEIIPLRPDNTIADFFIIEHSQKHTDAMYVAVDKNVLGTYKKIFQTAGLELVAIDTDSVSLSRLVPQMKSEKDAVLIVDIGARSTTMLVVDKVGVRTTFTRFTAGNAMTNSVAKALKLDATKAESEKIKVGLKAGTKVRAAIKPIIDQIGKDVSETASWHEDHHKSSIKEVVFVGGSSRFKGLLKEIAPIVGKNHPGITLRLFDVWKLVPTNETLKLKKSDSTVYAPAVGTALWGIRIGTMINLLRPRVIAASTFTKKVTIKDNKKSLVGSTKIENRSERKLIKSFSIKPFIGKIKSFLERKDKVTPPPVEAGNKKEKIKLIIAIGFLLLALGVLVSVVLLKMREYSKIEEQITALQKEKSGTTESFSQIEFPFTASIQPTEGEIKLRKVSLDSLERVEQVNASGGEKVVGIAGGTVTLYNTSGSDQALVATTRLLNPEGLLFRLTDSVIVPANGSITTKVYADQEGADYDIGPTTFIIPGLSVSRQEEVYAESSERMIGGLTIIGAAIDEDVNVVAQMAKTQVRENINESLVGIIEETDVALPELVSIAELNRTVITKSIDGEPYVEVDLIYKATAYVFSKNDIESLVKTEIGENRDYKISKYVINDLAEDFSRVIITVVVEFFTDG